ncbi:MAG: serine/threonine protein kinase [Prevotella sp.]|nr:serine/threonine protein kinase [Prevotella sp.]
MQLSEGLIVAEHYKLLKQLGQGSFGDVWLAHNLLADIDVAVKFYGTLDQKGLEEFRNEFKIAYKLHHPNLLNINHFDVYENCPYLVMPYCENGSVSRQIGQMPESEIWKFILDVSGGLAFLHSQQPPVVHQDIKPDNILITSDGRYVISDFGISRSFRTQLSRTNNVSSSGTIAYMGPERFSEKPMVVLASDIWAFGMTIYELMTGDVLWEGMGGCVQLNGARIPDISGKFSPDLTRLVTSCLAAETWNRPTAAQIHEYATAYLQKRTIPPLPVQKAPMPKPVITPQPSPVHYQPSHHSYHSALEPSTPQLRHPSKSNGQDSLFALPDFLKSPSIIKRGLLISAALIVAMLLITGGVKLFSSFSEEDDFNSCRTLQDYERFIKDHPTSSLVETARQCIATLTPSSDTPSQQEPQQQASQQQESPRPISKPVPEKKEMKQTNNQSQDIINFEESKDIARPNNNQTNAPAANQQNDDDPEFYRCRSKEDYHAYLTNYPNGKHRQAAEARLTELLNESNGNEVKLNDKPVPTSTTQSNINSDINPIGQRTTRQNFSIGVGTNRGRGQRSVGYGGGNSRPGGSPRSGGQRSGGGSSHRHSN